MALSKTNSKAQKAGAKDEQNELVSSRIQLLSECVYVCVAVCVCVCVALRQNNGPARCAAPPPHLAQRDSGGAFGRAFLARSRSAVLSLYLSLWRARRFRCNKLTVQLAQLAQSSPRSHRNRIEPRNTHDAAAANDAAAAQEKRKFSFVFALLFCFVFIFFFCILQFVLLYFFFYLFAVFCFVLLLLRALQLATLTRKSVEESRGN